MPRFRLFLLAALALGLLGCGGSDEKYYIPADNELRPFAAPEEDELTGETEVEEPEEEETAAEPAAEAASPAPAPAAVEPAPGKPAKGAAPGKPAKPAKAGSGSP